MTHGDGTAAAAAAVVHAYRRRSRRFPTTTDRRNPAATNRRGAVVVVVAAAAAAVAVAMHAAPAAAYTTGYDDCPSAIANGVAPGHGSFGSGTPPFALRVKAFGSVVTTWSPAQGDYGGYTVELYATTAATFRGTIMAPFVGTPAAFTDTKAGGFTAGTGTRAMAGCSGGVTHISGSVAKTLAAVNWMPPSVDAGSVTLWAVVVQCESCAAAANINWQVKLTLPQEGVVDPSPDASVSPTASLPPPLSVSPSPSPTASLAASLSRLPSPSAAASPSASVSASPSPSLAATPTATLSSGASASTTPSLPPSPSVTASGTASAASTASPSGTATRPASPSASGTLPPSAAASGTPSATPSASPSPDGVYASATPLAAGMTLRWRLPGDGAAGTSVDLQLEAPGRVWLAMGVSTGVAMLNRGTGATGSGPVVLGTPSGAGSVDQVLLTAQSTSGVTPVAAGQRTLTASHLVYDATGDRTLLSFSRPLAASGHASELAITADAATTFIYARGVAPSLADHGANRGAVSVTLLPPACSRGTTCSGAGTCRTPRGTDCVCDVGAVGATCAACAVGFAAAAAGGTGCQPQVAALDVTASVTLRLNTSFAAAGAPASPTRAAFVGALTDDVARALNVSAARLNVTSLTPGSVVATVDILPPGAAAGAPNATGASLAAAPVLAVALAALAADTSSALYAGAVTSALDAATPLAFAFAAAASYDVVLRLSPTLTFEYALRGGMLHGRVTTTVNCWAAVGVGTAAAMVGTDAVTFEPAYGAAAALRQAVITAQSAAGVAPVAAGAATLTATQVTPVGGGWVAVFARPLAAGGYAGSVAIDAAGAQPLVWATGAAGDTAVAAHSRDNRGAGMLTWSSGAYVPADAKAALRIAHGVAMALAWCGLLPAGVLTARYTKAVAPTTGAAAFWFRHHWRLQVAGVVVTAVGFALAVALVPAGAHFTAPHHIVGLVVTLVAVGQPVNAWLRPHKTTPPTAARTRWEALHKTAGYGVLLLAVANVAVGLDAAGAHGGLFAAFAVIVTATAATAALCESRLRARARATKSMLSATPPPAALSPSSPGPDLSSPAATRNRVAPAGGAPREVQMVERARVPSWRLSLSPAPTPP